VKEDARGLRWRFSQDDDKWPSLGFRRLGLWRWSIKGFSSSADVVREDVGRANAELEAGNEGLSCERASDMLVAGRIQMALTPEICNKKTGNSAFCDTISEDGHVHNSILSSKFIYTATTYR